jgi:2-haloacid dehalogenase
MIKGYLVLNIPSEAMRVIDECRKIMGFPASMRLAELERDKAVTVLTQNIDGLHRRILDGLLAERGLAPPEAEVAELNLVWHRLAPWPDSVAGLQRLKTRYPVCTLSNGNLRLLLDMARHAGLPWDTLFSAELFGHYKPDPEVYLGAARLLDLAPEQVLMVAAHPSDLRAAAACGLKTAYVPRPLERGPGGAMEPWTPGEFDVVAEDVMALAAALGA